MADFVAVLKKTLDGMGQTTPESRRRVYDKARQTVSAKLAAINPPPPPSVVDRQRRSLEDAIKAVEKEYSAASDPLAELEDVFASLKNPQPKPLERPELKRSSTARPEPAPTRPMTTPTSATPPPRPAAAPARPAAQTPTAQTPPSRPAAPQARQAAVPPPPPSREPLAPAPRQAPSAGPEVDEAPAEFTLRRPEPARKRSFGPWLVAAVLLAVIAGGGYGVWLNRAAFSDLLGLDSGSQTTETAAAQPEEPDDTAAEDAAAPESTEPPKFTQRLTPEGSEVDPGPANGGATVGEGTSVAGLTQAPGIDTPMFSPPADEAAAPAPDQPTAPAAGTTLAVAQKAIFYEERTSASEGSAEPGTTVWTLVQESPGANLPPEPAIRGEATIPGRDVTMRLTIRRNADQSLPASHILEMIFLTPEGFPGGGVDNILRVAMKGSEQEAGNPLIGIPAKIADGFFLVALNDSPAEIDANLTLLRRQSWIDIPVVYKSGRRALFTMEKGVPGDKVFDEALKAWTADTASAPG